MKTEMLNKLLDLLEMVRKMPDDEEPKRKKREMRDGTSKIESGQDE